MGEAFIKIFPQSYFLTAPSHGYTCRLIKWWLTELNQLWILILSVKNVYPTEIRSHFKQRALLSVKWLSQRLENNLKLSWVPENNHELFILRCSVNGNSGNHCHIYGSKMLDALCCSSFMKVSTSFTNNTYLFISHLDGKHHTTMHYLFWHWFLFMGQISNIKEIELVSSKTKCFHQQLTCFLHQHLTKWMLQAPLSCIFLTSKNNSVFYYSLWSSKIPGQPIPLLLFNPTGISVPHSHLLTLPKWDGGQNWKGKSVRTHGLR